MGQTMRYMMGSVGAPGIPRAQTLGQYDPFQVMIEVARLSADFDDILARLSDWDVHVELGGR